VLTQALHIVLLAPQLSRPWLVLLSIGNRVQSQLLQLQPCCAILLTYDCSCYCI